MHIVLSATNIWEHIPLLSIHTPAAFAHLHFFPEVFRFHNQMKLLLVSSNISLGSPPYSALSWNEVLSGRFVLKIVPWYVSVTLQSLCMSPSWVKQWLGLNWICKAEFGASSRASRWGSERPQEHERSRTKSMIRVPKVKGQCSQCGYSWGVETKPTLSGCGVLWCCTGKTSNNFFCLRAVLATKVVKGCWILCLENPLLHTLEEWSQFECFFCLALVFINQWSPNCHLTDYRARPLLLLPLFQELDKRISDFKQI